MHDSPTHGWEKGAGSGIKENVRQKGGDGGLLGGFMKIFNPRS